MSDGHKLHLLTVRRARPDELPACAAIYERVLKETFTWLPPSGHKASDFLAYARYEEVYVAAEAGAILGILAYYRPDNFVHSLYVDDRGRGVGRALLDHVEAVADGPLSLKVQVANTRAQAFYLREGFRVVEEGRDPPPGVPWLRMRR
jgi:ribosomal protein S18 acetylase RimI-like enzyme